MEVKDSAVNDASRPFSFPEVIPVTKEQMWTPLVRRKWLIALCVLAGGIIGGVIRWQHAVEYRAKTSVMVVNSASSGSNLQSGIAGALLGATQSGMQPTPMLLAKFAEFNSVLTSVAESQGPKPRQATVISQLAKPKMLAQPGKWPAVIQEQLDVVLDQKTGVVSISMDHEDSALARFVVEQTVGALTTSFRDAARGQATGMREANEGRAKVAQATLRAAEQRLIAFMSGNRGLSPFSGANVTLQGLQRDVQVAQDLYLDAAREMESARSKEIEQAPAVITVDDIPRSLPRVPRMLWLWMALGMVLALMLSVPIVLWREHVRLRQASQGK